MVCPYKIDAPANLLPLPFTNLWLQLLSSWISMSFSDDTTLVDPQMLSTAPDAGDTPSQSHFLDALSHDNGPNPAGTGEQHTRSRDIVPTGLSTSGANTDVRGESKAISEPVKTTGGPGEPRLAHQATLTFVIGGQRVSESSELGILNEHPEALEKITSDARLDTSSFLIPALQAAMGELRQSMKLQTAVRLSTVSLRMMAELLPENRALHQADESREDLPRGLLESVRRELDRALPYYQWQGPRNYCGRVQYIAALLEEGIRVLALPKEALTDALQLDVAAVDAIKRMAKSIQDLGQTPADVCGVWAAHTLLPASTLAKEADKSLVDEDTVSYASDGESDDLPSPSRLVPRKRVTGAARGEIATQTDTATPGSQAGRSWCCVA